VYIPVTDIPSHNAPLMLPVNSKTDYQTTTIAGDIVDNDCDGLIDEETNNGIGMLHHIVFDDILNYIVIVLIIFRNV
jgi:hypothetical protein